MKIIAWLVMLYNLIVMGFDLMVNQQEDLFVIIDRLAILATIYLCLGVIL